MFVYVAGQTWCLLRFLLLMIGHFVPEDDPHWENFLLLPTVLDYVIASVISPNNRPAVPPHLPA